MMAIDIPSFQEPFRDLIVRDAQGVMQLTIHIIIFKDNTSGTLSTQEHIHGIDAQDD